MEYSVKEKTIETVLTSATLETNIDGGKLDVVIGDAAKMDVVQAVTYIESGKAELMPLVVRAETAAEKAELYSKTFIYEQGVASAEWTIVHNLNKYPSVTVVDSAGTEFYPEVEYVSSSTCVVRMNGATTGKAYLN